MCSCMSHEREQLANPSLQSASGTSDHFNFTYVTMSLFIAPRMKNRKGLEKRVVFLLFVAAQAFIHYHFRDTLTIHLDILSSRLRGRSTRRRSSGGYKSSPLSGSCTVPSMAMKSGRKESIIQLRRCLWDGRRHRGLLPRRAKQPIGVTHVTKPALPLLQRVASLGAYPRSLVRKLRREILFMGRQTAVRRMTRGRPGWRRAKQHPRK